ncbi:CrpP-related protein [Parablastomonas sp. CN1-191]|uniref:CrpP-related protein n=1 Tax=Parablastomonas sp. CN1-191 TaxID=3400908 RepID=UPI003BF891AA
MENPSDLDRIALLGREARGRDEPKSSNPYDQWDMLPGSTGETVGIWRAKVQAWERGWTTEDGKRER